MRHGLRGALILLTFLTLGCHAGQVRLQRTPTGGGNDWYDLIDTGRFSRPYADLLYQVEAPLGYSTAVQEPLDGFLISTRIRWNDAIRPLGRLYDQLAVDHNEGRISVQEFRFRGSRLEAASKHLAALREKLDAVGERSTADRAHLPAVRAMPAETGRPALRELHDAMLANRAAADELLAAAALTIDRLLTAAGERDFARDDAS